VTDASETRKFTGFDPRPQFEGGEFLPLGQADFLAGGDPKEVLGRMAACYLAFRKPSREGLFEEIVVIAPPRLAWDVSDEEIGDMLKSGVHAIWDGLTPEEVVHPLVNVAIHRCERLQSAEVVAAVQAAGTRRICLIPEASKYRDDAQSERMGVIGFSRTFLPEDTWVPHFVRLATASLAVAKETESVLVFHSTEPLLKKENIERLNAVEQLYPGVLVDSAGKAPKQELLTKLVPRWVTMCVAGRSQEALRELEDADLSEESRREVSLYLAIRMKDRAQVLGQLRSYLDERSELLSDAAVNMGRTAHRFGDAEMARTFLTGAADGASDQMTLVLLLDVATSMSDEGLVRAAWERLVALLPNEPFLNENREHRLLLTCEVVGKTEEASPSRVGFGAFESHLADALYQQQEVRYQDVYAHVLATWPQNQRLTALCLAVHASTSRRLEDALNFAVLASEGEVYEERAAWILLAVLKRLFLQEVQPEEGIDIYKVPLLLISKHLSFHPALGQMRAELIEVLSVEFAGPVGLAVLAAFALDVIGAGAPMAEPTQVGQRSDDKQLKAFFASALHWMSEQPAIEPGVTVLPQALLNDNANRLLSGLQAILQFAARGDDTPDQLDTLEKVAYMMCLLKPYATGNNVDLSALRLFAAKCWFFGRAQRARDVAEQILTLAGDEPERRRLAWGCYADILHFTGSPLDALTGLACAAMTDAKLSASDLYQEAYVLLRVTRDLHFFSVARKLLPTCRTLYDIEVVGEAGRQRLDGIELSLEVAQASERGEAELIGLLERTQQHCAEVMAGRDELFSAASHFLQIAGMVERAGGTLPPESAALRAALEERHVGTQLRAVSAAFPTPQEVVDLYNGLENARYSDDVAGDQRAVVVAAHRLLLPRQPEVPPADAAVAVELLSDRALEKSAAQKLAVDWPASFVSQLSGEGLSVVMLATDSAGELVTVIGESGKLSLERAERRETSFATRLKTWSADYPYEYGLISREAGNVDFYSSMEKLGLGLPNAPRLLVVAQPALQQIPFNVALVEREFAGVSIAIGACPSLTWFEEVRKRPRAGTSKRVAWISCAPEVEAYRTLEMLYARLSPVFEQHGFETDTSGSIPANIRGADLAVVTAHGQLTSGKRFIHRIADEQEFVESPLTLARSLAGVELVILFVCSGGRVDSHPFANTTVSLPKMLLDRGCRVVVASPWPLDSVVPGNWLERFLEVWDAGDTVLDANFKANRYVSERLGPEAPLCLAMAVYGDVLLRKADDGRQ
jgi:CHAT domain